MELKHYFNYWLELLVNKYYLFINTITIVIHDRNLNNSKEIVIITEVVDNHQFIIIFQAIDNHIGINIYFDDLVYYENYVHDKLYPHPIQSFSYHF